MREHIATAFSVHAAPEHADAMVSTGAPLILTFGNGAFPSITMYCEDHALSRSLADAINSVIRGCPWQPIETAPKDGTPILAFCPKYGLRETYWRFYGDGSPAKADFVAGKPGAQSGSWDWSEPQNNWGSSWHPTHWMQLPTPPFRIDAALSETAP